MKYNIGDKIFIKNPSGDNVSKSIEGIAFTKDNVYYLTDAIDLAILGYEENEIFLDERTQAKKEILDNIEKLNNMIFDEKIKLQILESVDINI